MRAPRPPRAAPRPPHARADRVAASLESRIGWQRGTGAAQFGHPVGIDHYDGACTLMKLLPRGLLRNARLPACRLSTHAANLALLAAGELFVSERSNHRLQVTRRDARLPTMHRCDTERRRHVTSCGPLQVLGIGAQGALHCRRRIRRHGTLPGRFHHPWGVAVMRGPPCHRSLLV